MDIKIRRAEADDCSQILELVKELAEYERAPDEVTVSLQDFREGGFGNNPVWWAFVAEVSGRIVAFSLYYIRFSTWKGKTMYLEDILVTHDMRGKGIGKMLFDRLIEEAREKELGRISWQVLDWNAPAINFYKKYHAQFDDSWINCATELSKL